MARNSELTTTIQVPAITLVRGRTLKSQRFARKNVSQTNRLQRQQMPALLLRLHERHELRGKGAW